MNRQQRRAGARVVEHTARDAERLEKKTGAVLVGRDELEALHRMQQFFAAIVKDQGRVRVSQQTIDTLVPGDQVAVKRVGTDTMLTFVAGERPQEGTPA